MRTARCPAPSPAPSPADTHPAVRAILTYHSIDPSGSPISVSAAAFAAHVRWLASGRVRVVPLELLAGMDEGPDDAVALTFDDGFASVATEAAPRLLDHGLPATLFVVSGHVGRTNAWGGREAPGIPTLPLLGWEALGALAEAGFAIGAHTRTHPSLDALAPVEAAAEIEGAADELTTRTGRAPTAFAYPYGHAPPSAASCVRRRFAVGVTTELRPLRANEDAALLPRLDAYYFREPARLERWDTTAFRVHLRARRAARRARRWLGLA